MEGIRRALVLGLVLIAGTAVEQVPSVDPPSGELGSAFGESLVGLSIVRSVD